MGGRARVQFFSGSFDLSYVRYHQPADNNAAEPQQIAAGFWPGGDKLPSAAFYAFPSPLLGDATTAMLRPPGARFAPDLGYFLFSYDDARSSPSPEQAIMDFLRAVTRPQPSSSVGRNPSFGPETVKMTQLPDCGSESKRWKGIGAELTRFATQGLLLVSG